MVLSVRALRTLVATVLVAAVCAACGSDSDSADTASPSPPPSSTPSTPEASSTATSAESPATASASPSSSTPDSAASPSASTVLFPGHSVHQTADSVIANRDSYGKGWPWKADDVVMACSDAIGGAYLNASEGENYLLTGTITEPGFVERNAGMELWDGKDGDVYAMWEDAGKQLCPDAA